MPPPSRTVFIALAVFGGSATALATREPIATEDVFARFADTVVEIRVIERDSGAKAVIGSAFYADADGHLVTNYHVIAKLVHHADRYRAERVDRKGEVEPVTIRAIDVIHDLAIMRGTTRPGVFLRTRPVPLTQGARLYAMGHPHDLGLTIVEGTYNGLLEHTLYRRLHFTGSINPGMSGGPTLTAGGDAVGVNVRTAGNQVGFLVPIERANGMLDRVRAPEYSVPDDLLDVVRAQLLAHQEEYFATLVATRPVPTTPFGSFLLPAKLAPFFHCWGDMQRDTTSPYTVLTHECSTDDYVFVSDTQLSGVVRYQHKVLTATALNGFQFHALYSEHFGAHYGEFGGGEDDVTDWRCRRGFVRAGAMPLKTALCLRAYRRLPGLHDAVLKVAAVGRTTTGATSSLALSGVSVETVRRVVAPYLEAFAWNP